MGESVSLDKVAEVDELHDTRVVTLILALLLFALLFFFTDKKNRGGKKVTHRPAVRNEKLRLGVSRDLGTFTFTIHCSCSSGRFAND